MSASTIDESLHSVSMSKDAATTMVLANNHDEKATMPNSVTDHTTPTANPATTIVDDDHDDDDDDESFSVSAYSHTEPHRFNSSASAPAKVGDSASYHDDNVSKKSTTSSLPTASQSVNFAPRRDSKRMHPETLAKIAVTATPIDCRTHSHASPSSSLSRFASLYWCVCVCVWRLWN